MKPPTKADIRRELEAQVENYLREGGAVQQVERGISGRDSTEGPLKSPPLAEGELPRSSERTYVPEVVAAIEQRKQGMNKSRQNLPGRRKKPRKVIIYDDFGEPLRWQWEE